MEHERGRCVQCLDDQRRYAREWLSHRKQLDHAVFSNCVQLDARYSRELQPIRGPDTYRAVTTDHSEPHEPPGSRKAVAWICDPPALSRSHSTMSEQSDAQLVAEILGGDVESFGVLFQRYRDTCTRFAVRMLGSSSDADDVLQSAFMRAYRNLANCRDPDRFGGWLYQIVVNECRTFASRQRRRELRFVPDPDLIDRAVAESEDDSAGAMTEKIEEALSKLPVEQREAFLLKYVEEMSYEEIAEVTGVGVSALKMRVKRACDGLRDLLEGVYHD